MIITIPKPNPKQYEFMTCCAKYIGYGGARGGGKSWALRQKVRLLALNYPGITILIVRKTFADLRDNHIIPLQKDIPKSMARYRTNDKAFYFNNGSRIIFGYFDSDADASRYQGNEYDIICIDEATQMPEFVFKTLKASLRGANSFPKRIYLTCNPGGVGHDWVKRLFIDKHYTKDEDPQEYHFIKATVFDNIVLMQMNPEYVTQLNTLPDDLRRAWRDGEWDIFAGQFFPEFNRDIHVVEPFEIPKEWIRYRALDYGLDRLACLWIAVDGIGNAYVYRELCESDRVVSDASSDIISLSGDEEYYETLIPPDLFSRQRESGKSISRIFIDSGLNDVVKAPNERVSGWVNVKEYLKIVPNLEGNGNTAKLHIFSNCTELIECLPRLQHDKKNPCDCSTEPHEFTHAPDALRYFCSAHVINAKSTVEADKTDEMKYFDKIIKNNRRLKRYR